MTTSREDCFCEGVDTSGHHEIELPENWAVLIRSIADWDLKDFHYNPNEPCIYKEGMILAKRSVGENPQTQRVTKEGNCGRCGKYFYMVFYPPTQNYK